ncbi:hypothetical protein [Curtobacterium sp. MCBD17_021]|uniref:hypothetical protein n=1 Tax=Curtobacterium sp. MCBD17_021 TaxID=2175665 RepID=UPI000DAACDD9|nr:hypothetical protein [Curtobacterium sp. MCBD17_021]PZE66385.1 hypothetical protein DEI83_07145 [Curtobacterium sp. MCBD17_021]
MTEPARDADASAAPAGPGEQPTSSGRGEQVFALVVLAADIVVVAALLSMAFSSVLRLPEAAGELVLGLVFTGVPIATVLTAFGLLVRAPARRFVHAGIILVCIPLSVGGGLALALGWSFGPGGFVAAFVLFGVVLAFVLVLARRALRRPGPRYASNELAARDQRLTRLVVGGWVVTALAGAYLSNGPLLLLAAAVSGRPYDHVPLVLVVPLVLLAVTVVFMIRRHGLRRLAVSDDGGAPVG